MRKPSSFSKKLILVGILSFFIPFPYFIALQRLGVKAINSPGFKTVLEHPTADIITMHVSFVDVIVWLTWAIADTCIIVYMICSLIKKENSTQ